MEPSMQILATRLTGVAKGAAIKVSEWAQPNEARGPAKFSCSAPTTILGKTHRLLASVHKSDD
jgi:hypothetical protein